MNEEDRFALAWRVKVGRGGAVRKSRVRAFTVALLAGVAAANGDMKVVEGAQRAEASQGA